MGTSDGDEAGQARSAPEHSVYAAVEVSRKHSAFRGALTRLTVRTSSRLPVATEAPAPVPVDR